MLSGTDEGTAAIVPLAGVRNMYEIPDCLNEKKEAKA